MKVSELIEHLKTLDPEATVYHDVVFGYDGDQAPEELTLDDVRTGEVVHFSRSPNLFVDDDPQHRTGHSKAKNRVKAVLL